MLIVINAICASVVIVGFGAVIWAGAVLQREVNERNRAYPDAWDNYRIARDHHGVWHVQQCRWFSTGFHAIKYWAELYAAQSNECAQKWLAEEFDATPVGFRRTVRIVG